MSEEISWAEIRRRVAARAGGYCEYCRGPARISSAPFSIEHIIPSSRGGLDSLDNLALSCPGCNGHKATKLDGIDPETTASVPLYHPRNAKWSDHFRWSKDFTQIEGVTDTGRATVEELQLNRDPLVSLRALLIATGCFPPDGSPAAASETRDQPST
jgi:5-methylcytosine-specific restriction endonuclease McrA